MISTRTHGRGSSGYFAGILPCFSLFLSSTAERTVRQSQSSLLDERQNKQTVRAPCQPPPPCSRRFLVLTHMPLARACIKSCSKNPHACDVVCGTFVYIYLLYQTCHLLQIMVMVRRRDQTTEGSRSRPPWWVSESQPITTVVLKGRIAPPGPILKWPAGCWARRWLVSTANATTLNTVPIRR